MTPLTPVTPAPPASAPGAGPVVLASSVAASASRRAGRGNAGALTTLCAALAATLAATLIATLAVSPAHAGDCTGHVTGVRPITRYDHAHGTGYLAVRDGPGATNTQIGELYLGDEIAVWARRGNWYEVQCMSGQCLDPLWGPPEPHGWVYGPYLRIGGVCP